MSCLRRALPTLPRLTPLLLAALVGPLASCSSLIEADEEQCTVDADCVARGAAFKGSSCANHVCTDRSWGCLPASLPSAPNTGPPGQAKFNIEILLVMDQAPSSVSLRVCAKTDLTCTSQSIKVDSTDPNVPLTVPVTVPVPFKGYFEITSPDAITTLVFPAEHLYDGMKYPLLKLVPRSTLTDFATAFGTPLDPKLGHIIFVTLDCQGTPAAAVSVTPEAPLPSTRGFYMSDGVPSNMATATDKSGEGGAINIGTGSVTVNGALIATKQNIGSRTVLIRPETVSFFFIGPNP